MGYKGRGLSGPLRRNLRGSIEYKTAKLQASNFVRSVRTRRKAKLQCVCHRDTVPAATAFQRPEGARRGLRQGLALPQGPIKNSDAKGF